MVKAMYTDVLVVEDHPVVIEGLRRILREHEALGEIFVAHDGASCIRVMENLTPGLILLDINLPDSNGIDLCRNIIGRWPGVKIIAISSISERAVIKKMISAGASGYLLKNASGDEIANAVTAVLSGTTYYDHEVKEILLLPERRGNVPILTKREKEVLKLIAEGLTNSEIAGKIFVSTLTIDTHRKNLLIKLDARNSVALVRIGIERKLI